MPKASAKFATDAPLVFGRQLVARSRRRRLIIALLLVVALLGTGAGGGFLLAPERTAQVLDRMLPGRSLDSDGDGLPDRIERSGWVDADGHRFTSNPQRRDTDADGLLDGVEAGHLDTYGFTPVYASVSDPRAADSDSDGLHDTDELLQDTKPRAADTDADGLDDEQEIEFGSDPTLANGDADSWSDAEELDRGSDPLAFDLTNPQRASAASAGATYGDCYSCALDHGLLPEQVESVYYLSGQTASGLAVYGDLRDTAYQLWQRDLTKALFAASALVPFAGDAGQISRQVSKFAARSPRAADAAYEFVRGLPAPLRNRLPEKLRKRASVLPRALSGGKPGTTVYLALPTSGCPGYVGITNDFEARREQHRANGRCFLPEAIGENLTRGQAQAIEEACLVQGGFGTASSNLQNTNHSISPSKPHYAEAVAYGYAWMKRNGHSCA